MEVDEAVLLSMQRQIRELQGQIGELEYFRNQHQGTDVGQSGLNYPHPNIKVASSMFGGEIGWLTRRGIQIVKTSNPSAGSPGFTGIFFVPRYYEEPGFAPDRAYVDGLAIAGGATVASLTSVSGSSAADGTGGTIAGVFPTANNTTGDAYVRVRYALIVEGTAADPALFEDGMIWYRSDTDVLYARINGVSVDIGGGGSVIGSEVFRTTLDPTTWTVSTQNIATVSGGAVIIERIEFRVTTTLQSGGAATLSLGWTGTTGGFASGATVANLTAGRFVRATPIESSTYLPATGAGSGRVLNSVGSPNLTATVGTAVFTAGAIEMVIVYTPLTSGATIA